MPGIDFSEIKTRISLEQAARWLQLPVKKSGAQLRCSCPVHKGSDRSLAITEGRGWYCMVERVGGDVIGLVAHVKGIKNFEAAQQLQTAFGGGEQQRRPEPVSERPVSDILQKIAATLQASHEAVQALGISEETCKAWTAGFKPNGSLRARLAILVHDHQGTPVAYLGRALGEESPTLQFPDGFNPQAIIFGANRLQQGDEFRLVADPVEVLSLDQNIGEKAVAFLTETISAEQLQMLVSIMDEKGATLIV